MLNRPFMISVGFVCLMVACMDSEVAAQGARRCEGEIASAEIRYQNGAFEEAISLVSGCLDQPEVPPEQAVRAYRMLALAHFRREELQAARTAIVNLLGINPDYVPDTVADPPAYVSLVSLVKRDLQLGPSFMPIEGVQSLRLSSAPVESVRSAPSLPAPARLGDNHATFFQQASTSLTIGGVLIGSGVGSGGHVRGVGIGGLAVGAEDRFTGIGVGGLGVGGGTGLEGIMVGGLGVGSGDYLDGIAIGGIGVGSGGQVRGLALGGLGVGSGVAIRGVAIGGLAVGSGGDVTGLTVALLGVGGGHNVTGLTISGIGAGAGRHLKGFHVAGVGMAAPRLMGAAIGAIVASGEVVGGIVAPLYMRIADGGRLTGGSISLFNHVKGQQRGLTIGLINLARHLKGVQIGVLNYVGNNPPLLRVLPIMNMHF